MENLSNFRATCRHPEIIFMVDFLGNISKNAGNRRSEGNSHPWLYVIPSCSPEYFQTLQDSFLLLRCNAPLNLPIVIVKQSHSGESSHYKSHSQTLPDVLLVFHCHVPIIMSYSHTLDNLPIISQTSPFCWTFHFDIRLNTVFPIQVTRSHIFPDLLLLYLKQTETPRPFPITPHTISSTI